MLWAIVIGCMEEHCRVGPIWSLPVGERSFSFMVVSGIVTQAAQRRPRQRQTPHFGSPSFERIGGGIGRLNVDWLLPDGEY
jgi:hypothetical protein